MNVASIQLRVKMVIDPFPVVHISAPLLVTLDISEKF